MTVSSETAKSGPYTGNGVTTVFAYGFRILDASHIEVIRTVAGTASTVSPSEYTVSNVGNLAGGNVTFTVAPAAGQTITIIRSAPFTQQVDLENQGAYYAETIEEAFDLAAMRDQQMAEELERAVKIPVGQNSSALDQLVENVLRLTDSADEIDTVANISADVSAVAGISSDVTTVAGISANVTTVAGISADVTAVAGISSDVTTVAGISANVTTVASDIASVNTVAGSIALVNTVAAADADVGTVAGSIASVNTVADDIAAVTTVAGISADVTAVAGISSDVTTVATNLTDVTNFSDVYLGPAASSPATRNDGSALVVGDLFFNTTAEQMRVWDGAAWIAASSAVNGTTKRQSFTATAGQTVFAITGGYDAGFADVYLNGVKLVNGVDVDVTSGTDVVLTVGATVGDSVDVVAYGAFDIADVYSQAETDALLAAKASLTGAETLTNKTLTSPVINGEVFGAQPLGVPFPVWDHITGCPVPSNAGTAKFIKLTAGLTGAGQYNNGLLTAESVSGSAPEITATAQIIGGPMNGQTVPLVNTEQAFIRPGTVSGVLQNAAYQDHQHSGTTSGAGAHSHTIQSGGVAGGGYPSLTNGYGGNPATSSVGDHTHNVTTGGGSVGAGSETRPRNRSATFYMRVI